MVNQLMEWENTAVKTGEDIDYQNYLLLTILGLQDVSVIMKKHS